MELPRIPLLLLLASLLLATANAIDGNTTTYIVFLDPAQMRAVHASPAHWHASHLESLSIDPARHLLYSYSAAAHGFAAALLPHHLPLLRGSPEVLQVVPDEVFHLHTTRTPEFLGLLTPASYQPAIGNLEAATHDVVIGVLDTGVWPESPSFAGGNLPPPPARWKGACEAGVDFPRSACGRKLVGARSFSRGLRAANGVLGKTTFRSARDRDGHGTHTASTAAGAAVANASLLGYATGTARGMAPGARVAAYKVCWPEGCLGSDILAGIDAAVADGVGVLSLSLGGGSAPYFRDTVAVGAFGAAAAGVFVSCSAGNSGPSAATVSNSAPWVATVGAGTLDRDFPAYVTLPTGARLAGVSLYAGPSSSSPRPAMLPLVYGGGRDNASKLCLSGTLDPAAVRGKIVLCDRGVNARVEKGAVVKAAGGAGMVLANTAASGEELVADSHLLPAVAVGRTVGDKVREYASRGGGGRPMAMLSFGGTVLGVRPSPVVAAFSSRGPNTVVPEILKPDMIGPGVNILAGWSGVVGPTGLAKDGRRTNFNIISGTSMSCPHISGVAALLKAAHPNWSPAAIKSALMTTAYTVDNTNSSLRDAADGSLANAFAYGAGHVDPQKALSPGLVYDISTNDYVAFLCSLDYSLPHIQVMTKMSNISCPKKFRPGDLNYPSFSVVFKQKSKRILRFRREVTNVGPAASVYNVKVTIPESVSVTVTPAKLTFSMVGQKQRYYVTFASKAAQNHTKPDFGWISWVNQEHVVRSPVAFTWKM
nr:unnamed protein product [Digitaria exilis]